MTKYYPSLIKGNARRVFLIVADSLGIGAAEDSALYFNAENDDSKSNTLLSSLKAKPQSLPNLTKAGLFNIDGVTAGEKTPYPIAAYGRMSESSSGKDTITGHREIAGIISNEMPPVYPDGFPERIISKFKEATGRNVLCNKPYSGTQVLLDYGCAHIESGSLIVYTSGDSVFQIAAHEDVVPPEKLWEYCKIARSLLTGKDEVGRVIARPFIGEYPNFTRTANRRDFAFPPTEKTMLDTLKERGLSVIGIGKIGDIFARKSIDRDVHTESNADGIRKVLDVMDEDFTGLCFVNLVDFDSKFGHRRNPEGYSGAIAELDLAIGAIAKKMKPDDVLILTADHGCDPSYSGTDHTREYVPLIVMGECVNPINLGTLSSFTHVSKITLKLLKSN